MTHSFVFNWQTLILIQLLNTFTFHLASDYQMTRNKTEKCFLLFQHMPPLMNTALGDGGPQGLGKHLTGLYFLLLKTRPFWPLCALRLCELALPSSCFDTGIKTKTIISNYFNSLMYTSLIKLFYPLKKWNIIILTFQTFHAFILFFWLSCLIMLPQRLKHPQVFL